MILYPFTQLNTITVAAPGAIIGATSVPVASLELALVSGRVLDFGGVKFARLASNVAAGSELLDVDALVSALVAGDVASYNVTGHALLGSDWAGLTSDAQTAQHELAELWLREFGLTAGYTGQDAADLTYAIALQISAQLVRGIGPDVTKSENVSDRNVATTFRDRFVHAGAATIVMRVTETRVIDYRPTGGGL